MMTNEIKRVRVLLTPEQARAIKQLASQGVKTEGLPEPIREALEGVVTAVGEAQRRYANRELR